MKLVFIIGSGAVGKMTVGQALMERTGLSLFHNHMIIEPVLEVFNEFNSTVIHRLRDVIFQEFASSDRYGMIFTFMWAFDQPEDRAYVEHIKSIFQHYDTEFYCVELIADQATRLERNKTENRLRNKPSKRDVKQSEKRLLGEEASYRLVSRQGEIPFENYLRLDNSNISAEEAAEIIRLHFSL